MSNKITEINTMQRNKNLKVLFTRFLYPFPLPVSFTRLYLFIYSSNLAVFKIKSFLNNCKSAFVVSSSL